MRLNAIGISFICLGMAACAPATNDSTALEEEAPVGAPGAYEAKITSADAPGLAKIQEAEKGKVVVANYWATWCVPCAAEMPELAAFYNDMPEGVAFLSISTDHPSKINDAVRPFMEEREIPFEVIVLDAMPDDLFAAVDVGEFTGAVPATFVYDKDGALVQAWYEEVTAEILSEAVEPLL